MRVLMIHNRYKIRGGEDEVCDAEQQLLQSYGHEVDIYEENNERLETLNPVKVAADTIWSRHTHKEVRQLLYKKHYDIVHVHNFLPLISPSVFHALKAHSIPVVQTLHNYRLLCPNALFFRDGQICEACIGKFIPVPGIYHGCYRESRAATSVVAAMNSLHQLIGTWSSAVDRYIALTEFSCQKYIEGGIPACKISVKPNFVDPDPGMGEGKGGYALYVGRLSVEKGIDTLLEAWEIIGDKMSLKIIGDGPLAQSVVEAAKQNASIEWLGRKPIEKVYELMGDAKMLIFPSKWYETFGRVAVEAFSRGTPVIASDIGAIAEIVKHGETGLKFRASDPKDLANKVDALLAVDLEEVRHRARAEFEDKYTAQKNYSRIIEIYHEAISAKKGGVVSEIMENKA